MSVRNSSYRHHPGGLVSIAFTLGLACLAAICGAEQGVMVTGGRPTSITLDFGSLGEPVRHSAAGILHSFQTSDPPPAFVDPIHLRAFRGRADSKYLLSPGFYDRLRQTGVEHIQVVLSDSYGYPNGLCGWPHDANSYGCWEYVVDQTVRTCLNRGMTVEYDIWNEPNIGYFWALDRATWLETWRRGTLKVRQDSPGAPVVGPSISGFDLSFLREFLVYAQANNCIPDVLSWHELSSANGRSIPTHVQQAQALLDELQIDIHRFSINEIVPQNRRYNPGTAVSYFVGIENAPVESACHSCWSDVEEDDCENASLNGIVAKNPVRARAAWWAYKFYADTQGQKVAVLPSAEAKGFRIDVLAACEPATGTATIVLGNYESTLTRSIQLRLVHLESAGVLTKTGRIRAEIRYVPDLEKQPIDAPLARSDQTILVSDPARAIDLPEIQAGSAFAIRLMPDSAGPTNTRQSRNEQ